MTLQEAKDQVAKKYGHASWESLAELNPTWEYDEVAELYARSKWNEACVAQRQICWAQLDYQVNQNKVAKSPLAVLDRLGKPETMKNSLNRPK